MILTATPRPGSPLSALNPILGPVLATRSGQPAFVSALAVTCRAIDPAVGIAPHRIRLWLNAVDSVRFESVASSPQAFGPVLARARAYVGSGSSLPARRRLTIKAARALVGSLLTPVVDSPVSAHRQAMARHALAVVGAQCLASIEEKGWETALVTGPQIAQAMGCADPTALSAVRACIDLGWLHLVSRRRGGGMRVRLPRRLDAARSTTTYAYPLTVDAFAEDAVTLDGIAEVIAAAGHPSVAYDVGTKSWLLAIADEAEIDPVLLGVAKSSRPALRRRWAAVLVAGAGDPQVDEPLAVMLDRSAVASGALARAEVAELARAEAAEARRVEAGAHRAAMTALHTRLLPLIEKRHPIPACEGDTAAVEQWVRDVSDWLAGQVPRSVRTALRTALVKRLAAAGLGDETAERLAADIAVAATTPLAPITGTTLAEEAS